MTDPPYGFISDARSSASSDGSDADDSPNAPRGLGVISAKANVDVWSEVIPPFNLMPREALQVRVKWM
jgi:hypothetical protein